ncbi:MAG: hypothetical protein WCL70_07120 [Paludibacter sp.]
MNEIGGYFELELRKAKEYHCDALALNTGRNALELILFSKKLTKVYIPYFTCDAILEPFEKLKIDFEFYHINIDFEPVFNFNKVQSNEGFLYTNYFGVKDKFIQKLAISCPNLIIDSSQSFFSKPIPTVSTFYSCRKFFGVPDGAYLYLDGVLEVDFPLDDSTNRFRHLLNRIEFGAEAGYNDFKENENVLFGQPILQMSKLTKALLCNIDYEFVQQKRKENFQTLHKELSIHNELKFDIDNEIVPMVYPFWNKKFGLKQKLIDNKVFIATYWPNVIDWCNENDIEFLLTNEVLHLPVDQRYNEEDMRFIIKQIIS